MPMRLFSARLPCASVLASEIARPSMPLPDRRLSEIRLFRLSTSTPELLLPRSAVPVASDPEDQDRDRTLLRGDLGTDADDEGQVARRQPAVHAGRAEVHVVRHGRLAAASPGDAITGTVA